MYCGGHGSAVAGIFALLASGWFLLWAGEKGGNPYQKAGKAIGWIAVVLSALLIAGSISICIAKQLCGDGGKSCPRMEMMEDGTGPGSGQGMGRGMGMRHGMGSGQGMGPGMGMHRGMGPGQGMGPMGMPPPAPSAEQPKAE